MVYYLNEKYMQKFRHFGREKKFTRKSHLCPSARFIVDLNAAFYMCWIEMKLC